MYLIFFEQIFQKFFLKKFNFGIPEILNINFVSKLKNLKSKIGKDVIKWATIKFGLFFFIILKRGINEIRNIKIYDNLLWKKPIFGKNLKYFGPISTTLIFSFENSDLNLSHSPQEFIIVASNSWLYFESDKDKFIVEITVPTGFRQGDQ